jgi:hypothetical protein
MAPHCAHSVTGPLRMGTLPVPDTDKSMLPLKPSRIKRPRSIIVAGLVRMQRIVYAACSEFQNSHVRSFGSVVHRDSVHRSAAGKVRDCDNCYFATKHSSGALRPRAFAVGCAVAARQPRLSPAACAFRVLRQPSRPKPPRPLRAQSVPKRDPSLLVITRR